MVRFLLLVVLFFLAVLGFDWLKDAPGDVALTLGGKVYVVGLARAVAGLIAIIAGILIVLWLASFVWRIPAGAARTIRGRKAARGREAISRGLIAIAAGDTATAERAAAEAKRISPDAPLTLLLAAQAAQIKGDGDGARDAFTAMLDDPRTQIAGLHGLHVEAERAGEAEAARHFAAKAQELTHQAPWANRAILRHQIADCDWAGALATLSASADNRNIDRKLLRRHRAVILTAEAIDIEDSDPETARRLALEAHGLAPDLTPAATVAGRLLSRMGDVRRAVKVLEASWKARPHPEIAEAYAHVRAGDSARDRLKRIEALARMRPQADEGRFAVARAAIDAREWTLARETLMPVLKTRPTQNALILMSEIEEGEHGDRGRAREWLARAVHAPRDAVWIADGVELDAWAPVSPVTGKIDAVDWRVPTAQLGPPVDIDLDIGRPPEATAALPAAPGVVATTAAAAASSGPDPAAEPGDGEPLPAVPAEPAPGGAVVEIPASGETGAAAGETRDRGTAEATDGKATEAAAAGGSERPAPQAAPEETGKPASMNGASAPDTSADDRESRPAAESGAASKAERAGARGQDVVAAERAEGSGDKSKEGDAPAIAAGPDNPEPDEAAAAPSGEPVDAEGESGPEPGAGEAAGTEDDGLPPDPITMPRPDDPGVAEDEEDPDGSRRKFRIF